MIDKTKLTKIQTWLLSAIIFLIPTNLFWIIDKNPAYVNGLLVDYLLPRIYLVNVLVIVLVGSWLVTHFRKLKWTKNRWLWGTLLLLIARQFLAPVPVAAIWFLLQLILAVFLGWFLSQNKKLLTNIWVQRTLKTTIVFQLGVGLYQFISQTSLGGYLFLGEVDLAHSIGLAKDNWWRTGRVLPYGTTPHPNVLAGLMVVYWWLIKKKSWWWLPVLVVGLLTQSISALTALIFGFMHSQFKNKKRSLALGLAILITTPVLISLSAQNSSQLSVTRRHNLQQAALKMTVSKPILGVGLNQFTHRVEEYQPTDETVRFVQPVHHAGLLWLAETGLVGLLILWLLRSKIKERAFQLWMLAPILALDHYLLSLPMGLLTIALLTQKEN